jgi:hypothetical protein
MHDEDLREAFTDWLRPVREADPPQMPVIRRRLRRRRARMAAAGTTALAAAAGLAITVTVHLTTGPSGATAGPHPTSATASPHPVPATGASTIAAPTTGPSPIQGGYQVTSSYSVSAPVRTLSVSGGLSAITITGGSGSAVSVTEQIRYSGRAPVMTRRLAGGTLTLGYICADDESMCGVSYDIQVPRGIAVRAGDGDGTITLSSLSGPVTAATGLGTITATGLASRTADFTASTGEINAAFVAAPVKVVAATGLGAITIRVPTTVTYHVITDVSGIGTTNVTVPQASSSPHTISARTTTGTITVAPAAP